MNEEKVSTQPPPINPCRTALAAYEAHMMPMMLLTLLRAIVEQLEQAEACAAAQADAIELLAHRVTSDPPGGAS